MYHADAADSNYQSDGDVNSYLSSPWNNAVCYIEMWFRDQNLSCGSGFFWQMQARTYLVTNWHNLAGRNPLTGKPMSKTTAAIPDRIRFMAYKRISELDACGNYQVSQVMIELRICNEDLSAPRWLQHPTFGQRVDIAVIDVTDEVRGLEIRSVNQIETNAVLSPEVSQDVFVIGFPFGQIPGAPAPVWKRGSVAIDPTFNVENLPKMLVDTATRPGMSGSVVVARHIIVGRQVPRKDGGMSEPLLYAEAHLVAGIYSGRLHPHLERAQLGVVWKRSAIEEAVKSGKSPPSM